MTTKRERREALERMTKAELVKTIVALDARQTKLLNRIAELELPVTTMKLVTVRAPWETALPNPYDGSN